MRHLITLTLVCWGVACATRVAEAQGVPSAAELKEDAPAFLAEFRKLKTAMDKLTQQTNKGFASVKTEAEKEALMVSALEVYRREGAPMAEKALALVKSHAKDPDAVVVLTWILSYHPGSEAAAKAAELLADHHLQNPKVQQTASRFVYAPMPWTEKMLRALVAADLPAQKKAQAHFQLAQCLKSKAIMPAMFENLDGKMAKIVELRYGKEYLAELRASDSAKVEAEAIRTFEEVAKKYGTEKYGRKTLGDSAKSAIYEIRHLGIGKTAPEISGDDIDGRPMKLSDYRGKVVMLDFWGHW